MSLPARFALVFAVIGVACATGGQRDQQDDDEAPVDAAVSHPDANTSVTPDAPNVQPDASMPPPDAFVPPADASVPVDAPPSLFCTDNSQCTNPGECCVTLGGPMGFCAPGTVLLGECVPIT